MRVLLISWEYPPIIEGGLARHVRKLDEVLGELAHVPGEAAFDDRRVFPGDQQDAHTAPGTLSVAAWRPRQPAGAAAVLDTGAKFGDRRSRKLWTPSAKSGAVHDSSISRLASATVSGSVRS